MDAHVRMVEERQSQEIRCNCFSNKLPRTPGEPPINGEGISEDRKRKSSLREREESARPKEEGEGQRSYRVPTQCMYPFSLLIESPLSVIIEEPATI